MNFRYLILFLLLIVSSRHVLAQPADIGVTAVVTPSQVICTGQYAFSVQVKNFGATQVSHFYVRWQVNNGPLGFLSFSDTIAPGDSIVVNLGVEQMNNFGTYNCQFYTRDPNYFTDINQQNDTLYQVYTIVNTLNVELGPEQIGCPGDSMLLASQGGFSTYLWSTSDTTSSIYASATGFYQLTVTDAAGCTDKDTVLVVIRDGNFLVGTNTIYGPGESSATFADYNGDGYLDIFNTRPANTAYFTYLGDSSGWVTHSIITNPSYPNSRFGNWADMDDDGDEDLMIGTSSGTFIYRNDSFNFVQMSNSVFSYQESSQNSLAGAWADIDNDGQLDIGLTNNTGSTRLKKYNTNYGGCWANDTTLPPSRYISFGDLDNDGDQDLVLGNSTVLQYDNNGAFSFSDPGNNGLNYNIQNSSSVSLGDYDNDGDLDVFVATAWNSPNYLLRNDLNGVFTSLTTAGDLVTDSAWTNSSVWCDYDNDGFLDVLTTISASSVGSPFYKVYHNNGNGTFTNLSTAALGMNPPFAQISGTAIVTGDYDNDGDQDVYCGGDPTYCGRLFRNNGTCNSWLTLDLEGVISNRSAIGARVYAYGSLNNIPQIFTREITTQSGVKSESDRRVHFGLGSISVLDSLVIHWPSGLVQQLYNVPVNQFLNISEQCTWNCNGTVWPGNANNDTIVDAIDALAIGMHYGITGIPRINQGNSWVAHPAVNWNTQQSNGQDMKHVDCNGDGTVNMQDTVAIALNFGQVEYFPIAPPLTAGPAERSTVPVYLDFSAAAYGPGAWVDADILVSDSATGPVSMYGMAIHGLVPPAFVEPGSMTITEVNSWLVPSASTGFGLGHAGNGEFQLAITRINHSNSNGSGLTGKLRFQIPPQISQYTVVNVQWVSDTAVTSNGSGVPVVLQPASFIIDPVLGLAEMQSPVAPLHLFPVPASSSCKAVWHNETSGPVEVELISLQGEILQSATYEGRANETGMATLALENIAPGSYIVRVRSTSGTMTAPLMVVK